MGEFRMPSLGADMEAGTLVRWLVAPGATVKRGDIIAVVETQKGAIEIEVFEDGVLERQLVDVGAKAPVGTPLAFIRSVAPPPPKAPAIPAAAPSPAATAPPATTAPIPGPAAPASARKVRASPAARRRAAERGLDLDTVTGTGPGAVIVMEDVERALAAAPSPSPNASAASAGPDLKQMRMAIAAAMSRANREIPHYYLWDSCDLGPAQTWLGQTNAGRPPEGRLLMSALLIKATALAAERFPEFNGAFEDASFRPSRAVHVGVAIAIRGGGLVPPAIHDTSTLDLDTLMARLRDLVERVRAGRLRSSEISDPTITVSSLGERGAEALFGVIYPPQVALVGFGKVVERPWASGGQLTARPTVTISLAADHRVSDGHRGSLFLAEIARRLQDPGDL